MCDLFLFFILLTIPIPPYILPPEKSGIKVKHSQLIPLPGEGGPHFYSNSKEPFPQSNLKPLLFKHQIVAVCRLQGP